MCQTLPTRRSYRRHDVVNAVKIIASIENAYAVDNIVTALAKNDFRFSNLVVEITQSDPFRMRRGKDQKD